MRLSEAAQHIHDIAERHEIEDDMELLKLAAQHVNGSADIVRAVCDAVAEFDEWLATRPQVVIRSAAELRAAFEIAFRRSTQLN
jgi:hypothetical protein